MKRNHFASLAVLAAALAFGVAHAGGINLGGTTNEGGTGIGVGVGIGVAGAAASSESTSKATAIAAQHQNAQAISGGNSLASSVSIVEAAQPVSSASAPTVSTAAYTGSDPFVIKRLGLAK